MGAKFYDRADATSKLQNTIILYKGEPWFVLDARANIIEDVVLIQKIGSLNTSIAVKYTDDLFDYNNIELGYMSLSNNTSVHVCRRPGRYSFVGIKAECLDTAISSKDFLGTPMYNCIMGIHPSFEEAFKEKRDVSPFHRHAAILRRDKFNWSVTWMNKEVAMLTKEGVVTPFSNYSSNYSRLLKKIGVTI